MAWIDFNRPSVAGRELEYILDAIQNRKALCGNGYYGGKCCELLEKAYDIKRVLLTTSCTAALEMASILLDLKEGDEVIVPSYTFVSTVNAILLRGATPVFADIRPDTLNLDETLIEGLISERTRAIFVVHYAGVGAEMAVILDLAQKHDLFVVEDAAHGMDSTYKEKPLGTMGHLGTYSFHETKNVICGEGGALLLNDERFVDRAEILLEKGTNRKAFFEGAVDKYTWVDVGSSFVLSELNAAYLFGQLEKKDTILRKRLSLYQVYRDSLMSLGHQGVVRLPEVPQACKNNGHMFYLICRSERERGDLIAYLRRQGIEAVFHYVPLHTSPMGRKIAPEAYLPVTEDVAGRLIRLPMFYTMKGHEQSAVIGQVQAFFNTRVTA